MDAPDRHRPTARSGALRRLWATETRTFKNHLLRLDPDSRRLRFSGAVSDDFVIDYANNALRRALGVFGYFVDGELRGVSELHGAMYARTGEAAFTVEPAFQGSGVGTRLMGRVVLAARNRGMRHLVVSCLRENARMQKIAARHEADISFEPGEVIGTLRPKRADGFSLFQETVAETEGLARAFVDVHTAILRAA